MEMVYDDFETIRIDFEMVSTNFETIWFYWEIIFKNFETVYKDFIGTLIRLVTIEERVETICKRYAIIVSELKRFL